EDARAARAGLAHRLGHPRTLVEHRRRFAPPRGPVQRRGPGAHTARGGLAAAARRIRLRDAARPGAVLARVAPDRRGALVFSAEAAAALRAGRGGDRGAGRDVETRA